MRKDFFGAAMRVLALLGLLTLAACGSPLVATGGGTAGPGGLVIAVPRGGESSALEVAAKAYEQAGGERVQVEAIGADAYFNQVSAALLAGLDRYDVVYLSADELPKWVSYHMLQPLDLPDDASALEPWLPPVTLDGKLYGLPTQPDAEVLWYRADLLAAAGLPVPQDWEGFRRAALALNAPPERYGAAIAGSDMDAGADFAAYLAGFGGQAVGDDHRVQVDDALAQRALAFYTGLLTDRVVSPQAGRFSRGDVQSALGSGQAALGIAPLSAGQALLDCQASPKVCLAGKPALAWTWLPGLAKTSALGSLNAWAVPLRAAHPKQARDFLTWLAGADGARAWAQGGGLPANRATLRELAADQHPGAAQLAEITLYRLPLPPLVSSEALWKAYHTAIHAALSGKQTPAQALQSAAAQMQRALRQAGVE